jgi:transposase
VSRPKYQPLLLQDNAIYHTAAISIAALRAANIQEVPRFPPNSPDLNLIKGMWNIIKKRIYERKPRPITYSAVMAALEEEWNNLEPDDHAELILSMPDRVEAVLKANGGYTKY